MASYHLFRCYRRQRRRSFLTTRETGGHNPPPPGDLLDKAGGLHCQAPVGFVAAPAAAPGSANAPASAASDAAAAAVGCRGQEIAVVGRGILARCACPDRNRQQTRRIPQ